MKLESQPADTVKSQYVPFSQVKEGDTFLHRDSVWVKFSKSGAFSASNPMNSLRFKPETKVEVPNA